MKQKNPIVTYEFGNLYIDGQLHKEGDTALPEIAFNNLWDFILSNKADDDSDNVMSVHYPHRSLCRHYPDPRWASA